MLLDKENLFSNNQNVLATAYSSNVIRTGKGNVSFVPIIIQVTQTFTGLTSLEVQLETSATNNFSTAVKLASCSKDLADLKEGAEFPISYLPKGNLGYMRLKYVATGTGTAGKITAGVVAGYDYSYHNMPST